jgi:hypothetical protein
MATNDLPKSHGSDGAWIFLSHSHDDWKTVREVRNVLEGKGHKPLMFFLKCLDDDSELHELIRREIEARTWFLLCESEHAKKSRWVQEEVALIKSMPDKYFEHVILSEPLEKQIDRIDALCRRITVYLSYARADSLGHASLLSNELLKHDYYLREPEFFATPDQAWQDAITGAVDDALLHGFVLILLTPNSAKKEFVRYEVEYAVTKSASMRRSGSVVPVVFGDPRATIAQFSPKARKQLESTRWFIFDESHPQQSVARLISELKTRAID